MEHRLNTSPIRDGHLSSVWPEFNFWPLWMHHGMNLYWLAAEPWTTCG